MTNARQNLSVEALESQAFGLAARLHVCLRREKGRVTDVEYMCNNPVYCRHVIDLARDTDSADVHALCLKVEELFLGPAGVFDRRSPLAPPAQAQHQELPAAPAIKVVAAAVGNESKYIGRLR